MPTPDGVADAGGDLCAVGVSADRVRQELGKLLSSRLFPPNSRSAQFLAFVVEEKLAGRADEIKETSVAVQVFRRKASFDPRIDSIVRVEAHNLRKRLREYYSLEGAGDEVVIELPVGTYVPVIQARGAGETVSPPQPFEAAGVLHGNPSRRRGIVVILAAAAIVAGWAVIRVVRPAPPQQSVAILPFKNLGSGDNEILCQGLVEDLTTQLARVPAIRVTSRTSASQFQSGDVREIGKVLSVGAVLEGSVWREGGRMRFTAQLIDTSTGYHKWSQAFERGAADPLAAEAEVTGLIVAGVARSLGANDIGEQERAHAPDPEARRLFWEARYLRQQGAPEARVKATDLLDRAAGIDPAYADAWAALANLTLFRAFHLEGEFDDLARKTRSAAAKAIELDPGNTDGLVALAEMEWLQDRDWRAAERRLKRALDLNPSSASARAWLATGLVAHGRFKEALKELDRAAAISPISYVVSNDVSTALYCARQWDKAIRQARHTLEVNPKFFYARVIIGASLAGSGRYREAVAELRRAETEGGHGVALGRLGNALALAGQRGEAEAVFRELQPLALKGGAWVETAFVQTGLGDRAAAVDSLEKAFERHETDLNYVAVEPVFDSLRGEPRFAALKKKLGL